MRIVGIDPGSERTGYAIIDSDGSRHRALRYGVIAAGRRVPFHKRLEKIYSELTSILRRSRAEVMAIEEVFYALNVQSALKLGHARGIALLVAARLDIPVAEYSPLEIKNSIVGYGRAGKHQVLAMVRVLLGLPSGPLAADAADALAVAICHSHHMAREAMSGRREGTRS
jgi:crossover junction endodeoxyribonuclease RuvC